MRPYTNDIADVTAAYPNFVPENRKNFAPDYAPITKPITVPVADSEGRCRVELPYAIRSAVEPVVTIDGNVLVYTAYGTPVGPADVGISYTNVPILEFHPSLTGETGTIVYAPLTSVRSSDFENRLQAELAAHQSAILATAPRQCFIPGVPGTSRILARLLVLDNGAGTRNLSRLTAFAAGTYALVSGVTTLYITTASTATGGQAINLPATGSDDAKRWLNLECDLNIDTSSGSAALNVFCTANTGGHGDITLEAFIA